MFCQGRNLVHRHLCSQQFARALQYLDCLQCSGQEVVQEIEFLPPWFSQPLVLRPWYWWGELQMSQPRKREGRIQGAEFGASLRWGGFLKAKDLPERDAKRCLWRVPTREDNVGNAVTLGWDLFSLTGDPWHNCPFADFQHRASSTCQRHPGQLVAGQSSDTTCRVPTGMHTCTSYGYSTDA